MTVFGGSVISGNSNLLPYARCISEQITLEPVGVKSVDHRNEDSVHHLWKG